jgi:hypothetical protein
MESGAQLVQVKVLCGVYSNSKGGLATLANHRGRTSSLYSKTCHGRFLPLTVCREMLDFRPIWLEVENQADM